MQIKPSVALILPILQLLLFVYYKRVRNALELKYIQWHKHRSYQSNQAIYSVVDDLEMNYISKSDVL